MRAFTAASLRILPIISGSVVYNELRRCLSFAILIVGTFLLSCYHGAAFTKELIECYHKLSFELYELCFSLNLRLYFWELDIKCV